jgi:hypothetical protein
MCTVHRMKCALPETAVVCCITVSLLPGRGYISQLKRTRSAVPIAPPIYVLYRIIREIPKIII